MHNKIKSTVESMFNKNLIEIISKEIELLAEKNYKHDECKPIYTVSILYEGNIQEIILTVNHLNHCFSRKIFPRQECFYDYESMEEIVISLYNQTM